MCNGISLTTRRSNHHPSKCPLAIRTMLRIAPGQGRLRYMEMVLAWSESSLRTGETGSCTLTPSQPQCRLSARIHIE